MGVLSRAETLRIVNWNIDADNAQTTSTFSGTKYTYGGSPSSGGSAGVPYSSTQLESVLEAIGTEKAINATQTFDVLALEELYSTSSDTLSSIVTNLNAKYGAGVYAYDRTTDPVSGGGTGGGGPSGLIYDTKTVSIVNAVSIGTVGSGSNAQEARAPMRYTIQPVGQPTSTQFYLYVEHAKSGSYTATNGSGSTETNGQERNNEVTGVRADADALGSSAHVIYTGDYNFFNGSAETGYQTLTSTAGNGRAIDPDSSFPQKADDEQAQSVEDRDELQLYSSATQSQTGVQYIAGSFNVFGNNGSTASGAAVNASSNTALSDLGTTQQQAVLTDLTQVTDHLPVEADYAIVLSPEPATFGMLTIVASGALLRRKRRRVSSHI